MFFFLSGPIDLLSSKRHNTLILYLFNLDGAATNKQHVTTKNTAKLDRETEELKHDKIPLDVGKLIMQGRQAKGLSQKDLATVNINDFLKKYFYSVIAVFLENLRKTSSSY